MMQPLFNPASFKRSLEKEQTRLEEVIISRFRYIGETALQLARDNGNYRDVTGNLRSSIGYLILRNGEVIEDNFPGKENTGQTKGQALARQLAEQYPSGYVLIIVAGMEYAASVESRGKDVLTASGIVAEQLLREAMDLIAGKVAR